MRHRTSLKELLVEFLLCYTHIRLLPCEKLEQRKPRDIVLFFYFILFLYFCFFEVVPKGAVEKVVGFVYTNISRSEERGRETWPPFGFYDASPIYDVPMVKNEAIII